MGKIKTEKLFQEQSRIPEGSLMGGKGSLMGGEGLVVLI